MLSTNIRERRYIGPAAQSSLFYLGFYGAGGAYIPFINVFFAHRGLSGSEIGLLSAIGPLAALLVAPALAALADRRGWHKGLLTLALAGTAVGLLILPFPTSFVVLLILMALLAVVGSPSGAIADGIIAHLAERRGLAYGKLRLWGSLSWALAAGVGGILWQNLGLFLMFPAASLIFLATVPVARLLAGDRPTESQARAPFTVVLRDVRLRVVLIASFVLGLAMATSSAFGGIYLDRLGGGQVLVGLFSGITALTELPIMHASERISRRFGSAGTLVLAYAFFASSYCGLILITDPTLVLGVAGLQGVGFGLFLPTTVRMVASWAPGEWSSTAQGLLNAALWGLAPLIAAPLGGFIYDAAGPASVFLLCLVAALAAALVLIAAGAAGVFRTPVARVSTTDFPANVP